MITIYYYYNTLHIITDYYITIYWIICNNINKMYSLLNHWIMNCLKVLGYKTTKIEDYSKYFIKL